MRRILLAAALLAQGAFALAAGERAAAWKPVLLAAMPRLQARAGGVAPRVQDALGHLRFDLALNRGDRAVELLTKSIRPEWDRRPQDFAALTPGEQEALLLLALDDVRTGLDAEGRAFARLARMDPESMTPIQRERLAELSQLFYLMSPAVGAEVKAAAAEVESSRVLAPVARYLRYRGENPARATVDAEIQGIFDGAQAARSELVPYAERAVAQAARRLDQREDGLGEKLRLRLLKDHHVVFADLAPPELVRPLRKSGDWTDFVAALSLAATEGLSSARHREELAPLSVNDELLMPIPAAHPLAGQHETVADRIAARFGPAPELEVTFRHRFFSLLGIPVGSDRTFPYVFAWVAFTMFHSFLPGAAPLMPLPYYLVGGLAIAVLTYASLLAHEFGHILVARRYGIRTYGVLLSALGGMAIFDREPRKAGEELAIAVAGPGVSVLLAGAFYWLGGLAAGTLLYPILHYLFIANAAIAFFNLILPAFPMDAARIVRSALTFLLRDDYRAGRLTAQLSRVLAPVVLVYAFFEHKFILGLISLFLIVSAKHARRTGTTRVERR